MLSPARYDLLGICLLGIATMFMFLGYDTQSFIMESVLHSVHETEPGKMVRHAGYYGQAVMYAAYSITALYAPWICSKLGSKWTGFIGSCGFTLFLAGFQYINSWYFFISQAVMGFGFALYYSCQGIYIAEHSTRTTISRNSVIVAVTANTSMLLGGFLLLAINSFIPKSASLENSVYRVFGNIEIKSIYGAFLSFSIISNILYLLLPTKQHDSLAMADPTPKPQLLKQPLLMFEAASKHRMLALVPFFIFYGFHVSFWLLALPTAFSFSSHLSHNHHLPAFYSIMIGVGNIVVGAFIHRMSLHRPTFGMVPTMIVQALLAVLTYFLTAGSIPNDAAMSPTTADAILFQPTVWTSLMLGFLNGGMDCCSTTMRSVILTLAVPEKRLQCYSIAKIFQSIATCISAFCAPHLSIYGWVSILITMQLLSSMGFYYVSLRIHKNSFDLSNTKLDDK